MLVKLHYFAWIKERLGVGSEEVELPQEVTTISQLFDWLLTHNPNFENIIEHRDILQVAIDQEIAPDKEASILQAREIALFPPMTGG